MRPFVFILLIAACYSVNAQELIINNKVEGYYEGAIIRGNSVLLLTADFYKLDDTLYVDSNVKEWTYYSPRRSKVEVSGPVLKFNTYMGMVEAAFDTVYTEMVGVLSSSSPAQNIHLKKVRRPSVPPLEIRELTFEFDDITLNARVIIPKGYAEPMACAIYVPGRGCQSLSRSLQKAKVLAGYGMVAVTFDRRGAQGTDFDCEQTTLEMHGQDLQKVIGQVAQIAEVDASRIGLIGGSYGGWLAVRASRQSDPQVAFIISTVGPSTSVQQQQLDNAVYYTQERLGGDPEIIRQIQEYTLLEYETGNNQATYDKMMALLEKAEEYNWKGILSKSDIPESPEDLDKLWVKRNRYDPGEDLKNFEGPFLSILGERDRVVPWKENSKRFQDLFDQAGKTNYKIIVIPGAPHRMEHGNMVRDFGRVRALRSHPYYFKFDRVVPGVMDEQIRFLREYDFLP